MKLKNFANRFMWYSVIAIVICFVASTIISIKSLHTVILDHEETHDKFIADNVYDIIMTELEEPIAVGETIASDVFIKDLLTNEDSYTVNAEARTLKKYLSSIANEFGYSEIFLISDDSKRYYNQTGYFKTIEPETSEHDRWYQTLLDMGNQYVIFVDGDEARDDVETIFINGRIEGEDGSLLGVCGTGIELDLVRQKLAEIQNEYGIKISVVDREYNLIVGSEGMTVDEELLRKIPVGEGYDDAYVYQRSDEACTVGRFMPSIGYYLIIDKEDSFFDTGGYREIIFTNILFMAMMLILLVSSITVMIKRGNDNVAMTASTRSLSYLAEIYMSMYIVNLKEDSFVIIKTSESIRNLLTSETEKAREQIHNVVNNLVTEEFRDEMLSFTDFSTLAERMKNQKTISYEFKSKYSGWCRARFIADTVETDKIEEIIYAVEIINDDKLKEEKLKKDSIMDALTGCYNRKAYETDIKMNTGIINDEDYVYISMDVNGLKIVNDTLGHAAGDEILRGAAGIMQRCMASYGCVYRIGGDEFIAVLFVEENKLAEILANLNAEINLWHGELVDSLAIAYGYVIKSEYPGLDTREIAKIADKKMYEAKNLYYKEKGIDRKYIIASE